jgi:hypothetical protein
MSWIDIVAKPNTVIMIMTMITITRLAPTGLLFERVLYVI